MPRLRKPEAIMLSDDELYALIRATFTHPKVKRWEASGVEAKFLNDAYNKMLKEQHARWAEEHRIEIELKQIDDEYKEKNKYEHTN